MRQAAAVNHRYASEPSGPVPDCSSTTVPPYLTRLGRVPPQFLTTTAFPWQSMRIYVSRAWMNAKGQIGGTTHLTFALSSLYVRQSSPTRQCFQQASTGNSMKSTVFSFKERLDVLQSPQLCNEDYFRLYPHPNSISIQLACVVESAQQNSRKESTGTLQDGAQHAWLLIR